MCADKKLKLLNSDVITTIGIAENNSELVEHIINVNEDSKIECGEYTYQPITRAEIMKFISH